MPPADAALVAAAQLGPFCAVDADAGPGALDLADGPGVLDARAAAVSGVLGLPAGSREALSLVHLGVVARVLSPALGAALVVGVLPVPERVVLQPVGSNPVPMAWSGVRVVDVPRPVDVATALTEHWLLPLVAPWTDVVAARSVSRRVLDGNVVSALHGTGVVVRAARPGLAGRSRAVLDALLTTGPLAGTGGWRADGSFVRRSCCLLQRLPGAFPCADCVLDRPVPA